ncbi:hypothetical protein BDK51DRAFT_37358 [Blyttiomyces helicus]|uniref:Uncharacterized protein n=1 Tax=Blyttiomyces helicus TaxID=388810 RepID=A0A4P9WAZ1_9FUNG|nr:hypothetical protein BDK51DRAFT_37358 [Blyttiomyces helicus]|eukprot:RKO88318.1 hypothetical protein BDK51DRAFT_37358 [Blyttiomyces helicus]
MGTGEKQQGCEWEGAYLHAHVALQYNPRPIESGVDAGLVMSVRRRVRENGLICFLLRAGDSRHEKGCEEGAGSGGGRCMPGPTRYRRRPKKTAQKSGVVKCFWGMGEASARSVAVDAPNRLLDAILEASEASQRHRYLRCMTSRRFPSPPFNARPLALPQTPHPIRFRTPPPFLHPSLRWQVKLYNGKGPPLSLPIILFPGAGEDPIVRFSHFTLRAILCRSSAKQDWIVRGSKLELEMWRTLGAEALRTVGDCSGEVEESKYREARVQGHVQEGDYRAGTVTKVHA